MEERELNPYEQQLLAVFESCDRDQCGSLDGHGLEQLCEQLQLEEQGFELMKCLLGSPPSNKRVSFSEFRDGLLALLAHDQGEPTNRKDRGCSSPEREVSPKFVFGSKKYGRRSRPESTEDGVTLEEDESLDDSDLEIFGPVEERSKEITMRSMPEATLLEEIERKKKRKSTGSHSPTDRTHLLEDEMSGKSDWQSTTDVNEIITDSDSPSLGHVGESEEECLRAAWERLGVGKDGFLDREELALVCECIGMAKVAEEVVQQLFEKLDVDRDGRISFEEFLLLFRSGGSWVQQNTAPSPVEDTKCSPGRMRTEFQQHSDKTKERNSLDQESHFLSMDPNNAGHVNAELILEMWEAAGIPGPSQLLQDLGFSETQRLNIAELAAVLEEELRSLNEDKRNEEATRNKAQIYSPHETLLQATLALYQTEVRCLKLSLEHMSAERDKLRADLMDANQRATLLAQEIDDHHARLEKSSQMQVKLLEQKHAEQLKALSEQLGSDREQLAMQNSSLEKQLSGLQEEETRLRSQVSALESENEILDKENHNITEQLSKSEETRIQLQKELESLAGLQQRLSELEGNHNSEQMLPLLERINQLQEENTELRDRNDELTMEVESLAAKLASLETKKSPSQMTHELSEGMNTSVSATKRRGNSPLVLASEDSSEEESPRLGKVRRCCEGGSGDSQDVSLETVNMQGLQIHPVSVVDGDEYAISAVRGENKQMENGCSQWMKSEMVDSSEETIARLKAYIAELEQELKLKNEKLVVCEEEQRQLKGCLSKIPQNVPDSDVGKDNPPCGLGKEESRSSSSRQEYVLNQRTDLPDMTDSEATNLPLSSTGTNGAISDTLENTKDVEQLETQYRDLKSQLDLVKVEIVKILYEKKACSKENCALKNHISDLKNQLPTDIPPSSRVESSESVEQNNDRECISVSAETTTASGISDSESKDKKIEELSEQIKEEGEKHVAEITTVKERCVELEKSLELLRQEYEKCEDYWANKLEEERHLYDQEQKLSDEKFSELMSKIKEYEEMLGGQDDHSDDSDRLSTIDERASLEKQFTDLEDEFEEFRLRVEMEQTEREEEIERLREQLKVTEKQYKHPENKLNVAVQVSDLENGSWESDHTFVVELDGARKAAQPETEPVHFSKPHSGLTNGYSHTRNKWLPRSRSSSPQSGPSTYNDNPELVRLRNLKEQLDEECQVLLQQKEALVQEVLDIEAGKMYQNGNIGIPFSLPPHWTSGAKVGGQACRIDLSVLQTLNARLRQQEQQNRNLQLALKQHQKQSESVLKCTWQKHREEINTLQSMLQSTQERLTLQTTACKEQMDRLARTDILVKDLYVENAYLVATVQRLEQHCHILVQMSESSSSV